MKPFTVDELASRFGGRVEGDGSQVISGIAGIQEATTGECTFVANERYAPLAESTGASALLVTEDWSRPSRATLIRVGDPDKVFAEIAELFAPEPWVPKPGCHASALVSDQAEIPDDVHVGPHCVIEPGVRIGSGSVIHALCYIGRDVQIGKNCVLYPHVSLREHVQLGDRVMVHNGTVIGSDGFGYTVDQQGIRSKIRQLGTVEIANDVEIGANVTIDRARFGKTYIGQGVKVDNLVQIAHNVQIGDHAVVVAQTGISGSSEVGEHAILAGQSGVGGHLKIGPWAVVAGRAGVTKDVPPKTMVSGFPAAPHDKATKIHAHLMRLPKLKEKVANLEKRLKDLEKKFTLD